MTTNEFIEMLRKADPSGTAHVRMDGGVPLFAELKPGYWDGHYSYIEDGKFITSTQGVKLDIHTSNLRDFVIDRVDMHHESWEQIKEKLVFDFGDSPSEENEKKIERYMKSARHTYDCWYEM
jgi:hypothetical protein